VVVGNSGDEIFTDKYGRVKVQFHWDRLGTSDPNSSCWIRVGTMWSGVQWGTIFIPRVGQEVIVAFEEGDPDQPIIVGSVYNDQHMPPYTLPDNMTQSGILSRSTLNGTADNFNQLQFEDKKGSEFIYFHAEKDFTRVVENNDSLDVGASKKDKGDQTVTIYNNQTTKIGTQNCDDGSQSITVFNDQTVKIGDPQAKSGCQTITVYKDRTETVKTGNESVTIEKGNRSVEISMGNESLAIKMGNQTTKLDLGASSTEAMQSITLKVGQSSIVIDQMGVTIKGMMISVQGQVQTEVKGLMTSVSGDAMLTVKGGITMIN
jgi:type VI secretion system secreted protein VgrG